MMAGKYGWKANNIDRVNLFVLWLVLFTAVGAIYTVVLWLTGNPADWRAFRDLASLAASSWIIVYAELQRRAAIDFICTDFRVMNARQLREDCGSITEHSMAILACSVGIILIMLR